MRWVRGAALLLAVAMLASTGVDGAQSAKKKREAPAPPTPGDKRDRLVSLAGSPFNNRAYWLAMAQCGGIYFKLNALYSDGAIKARLVKPDPAAQAQLKMKATETSLVSTAFLDAAERFLIADRQLNREQAIMTYDPRSSEAGDRLKGIDAGVSAAKPCLPVYQACRSAHPQICKETLTLTN